MMMLLLLFALGSALPEVSALYYADSPFNLPICGHAMQKIATEQVASPYPPEIDGIWVSSRCETRPGPEYLLRKYQFDERNHRFNIVQFYYYDSHCTKPMYTLKAEGKYQFIGPSWDIPGGTEAEYSLERVQVMTYSERILDLLKSMVESKCQMVTNSWKISQFNDILRSFDYIQRVKVKTVKKNRLDQHLGLDEIDCTEAIFFAAHELQLMRVEHRTLKPGQLHQELLMGNLPRNKKDRSLFRPTAYQTALKYQDTPNCKVCSRILVASAMDPPRLKPRKIRSFVMGSWVSERCEARPSGPFITRKLSISSQTWQATYRYYYDALCHSPSFTLRAKGTLSYQGQSHFLKGAQNYLFVTEKLKITPQHEHIVAKMNDRITNRYCGSKVWKLNKENDISGSGCLVLGLSLPHYEYEILKLAEHDSTMRLYIGERPSDGSTPNRPEKRATSFQEGLLECEDGPAYSVKKSRRMAPKFTNLATNSVFISWTLLVAVSLLSF